MTKKEELKKVVESCKKKGFMLGVLIKVPFCNKPEIVINFNDNLDEKYAYYDRAYDDNLYLKNNKEICIVDFIEGKNGKEIMKKIEKK